jgi:thiol-disulfide isomerase/thioredoxin
MADQNPFIGHGIRAIRTGGLYTAASPRRLPMLTTAAALLSLPFVAAAIQPAPAGPVHFGFDPGAARILHDSPELRVSMMNDAEHLYIQAILWNDGDAAPGQTADGRAMGDSSTVMIDADADQKPTANVDRSYSLSPWPHLPGLHYSVTLGGNASTPLKADSRGRGHISYIAGAEGKTFRVDSFLIPLEELGREPGETIRLAYWGSSTVPEFTLNSVGLEREGRYYPHHLPRDQWHEVALSKDGASAIDVQAVPEGRGTIERPATKPQPKVGEAPPPFAAEAWLNWKGGGEAPTLENLKGKVVVVEFWATWCGPCIAGIPHLNEIHEKHTRDGMVLLSLTDQSRSHVEEFMAKTTMNYTVGVGSRTANDYGVRGIPQAFIIGRDGKVAWAGHPGDAEFDRQLVAALAGS